MRVQKELIKVDVEGCIGYNDEGAISVLAAFQLGVNLVWGKMEIGDEWKS